MEENKNEEIMPETGVTEETRFSPPPGHPPVTMPAAISLAVLAGAAALCAVMALLTRYIPFALLGIIIGMPTLVISALLFSKLKSTRLPRLGRCLMLSCAAVSYAAGAILWIWLLGRVTSLYSMTYLWPILLLCLFVVFIILDKVCKHAETADAFDSAMLKNIRSVLAAGRFSAVLVTVAAVIGLLGFFELQKYLIWALDLIYVYTAIFLAVTFAARMIRHELDKIPDISIPMPFAAGDSRDLGVISYLEENTGITMRSLWSIKLIKTLLPYMALAVFLILWAVTGIVQIGPGQQGALYTFGRLSSSPLTPGLHLTLPYPFSTVAVYDTEAVKRVTIGYTSEENSDNTWTASHGTQEFKLLLGGGSELVSINLRIEYKISDLKAYLQNSSAPEKLLQAMAYELITARTISTDLDTLMSVDREAFAENFAADLSELAGSYSTGINVVSVIVESIHPPVDIAEKYQMLVSAGIRAEKYILEAEASAARKVAYAESERDTRINAANAESSAKTAAARSDVAEFMASVEADTAYPDAYRYYKYLSSVTKAYGQAKLVIVGSGIDGSQLYFGSISPQ